jgi:hypothetical protein
MKLNRIERWFVNSPMRREFETVGLELRQSLELKRLGILGMGVKSGQSVTGEP